MVTLGTGRVGRHDNRWVRKPRSRHVVADRRRYRGRVAVERQKSLARGQIAPCRARIRIQRHRRVGQCRGSALEFLRGTFEHDFSCLSHAVISSATGWDSGVWEWRPPYVVCQGAGRGGLLLELSVSRLSRVRTVVVEMDGASRHMRRDALLATPRPSARESLRKNLCALIDPACCSLTALREEITREIASAYPTLSSMANRPLSILAPMTITSPTPSTV